MSRHGHLVPPNMSGPLLRMCADTWRIRISSYLWITRLQYKHHINLSLIYHRNQSLSMEHVTNISLESWYVWWIWEALISDWRFLGRPVILRCLERDVWINGTICLHTWRSTTTMILWSTQVIKLSIKSVNVKIGPQVSLAMSLVRRIYYQTCLFYVDYFSWLRKGLMKTMLEIQSHNGLGKGS